MGLADKHQQSEGVGVMDASGAFDDDFPGPSKNSRTN